MADDWEHAADNSYKCWLLAISELRKRRVEELALFRPFQERAQEWAEECFGADARNPLERGTRAAEEGIELAQALLVPKTTLLRLVEDVYSRPRGHIAHEVGDVALIAACIAQMFGHDVNKLMEERLASAISRTDQIREKHKHKIRRVSWE